MSIGPYERVIEALRAAGSTVSRDGKLWQCPVPGHGKGEGDRNPSLSLREANGKIILKCFAGCSRDEILGALGLDWKALYPKGGEGGHSLPPPRRANLQTRAPLTVARYAEAKKLPAAELAQFGVTDAPSYPGGSAVAFSYRDESGQEVARNFRLRLEKQPGAVDDRFRWKSGSRKLLYGLWRLEDVRKAGYAALVEGESDSLTLWHHGIPALGVPGASTWKDGWASHLDGVPTVFLVVEPDKGGITLRDALGRSPLRDRLRLVSLNGFKDPSELHLASPEGFREAWDAACKAAVPYVEIQAQEEEARGAAAWERCQHLATNPRILDLFKAALKATGTVGEERSAQTTYLAVTSRVFPRPVSAVVKGPSAAGKSHETEQVLRFFPEEAYFFLTSMSDKALVYLDEPLARRMLVVSEAVGLQSETFDYMVRTLLSEGRIKHWTVEKDEKTGQHKARLVELEGPTGLLVTTTAVELHPENETRMLSLPVDDSRAQTERVLDSIGEKASAGRPFGTADPPDVEAWRALQTWIQSKRAEVVIPYAMELTDLIIGSAVRLRRDIAALMVLIQAHALLHQASRERDDQGRIVATLEDYRIVRELVSDLLSEGVGATVSKTIRDTVEAVAEFLEGQSEEKRATVAEVARQLKLDHSAAYRRVQTAIAKEYLRNDETRERRPARLRLGDPLPGEDELLPAPEALAQGVCRFAEIPKETKRPPSPLPEAVETADDGLGGDGRSRKTIASLAPGPLRDEWEERAGTLEGDGVPRAQAKYQAAEELGLVRSTKDDAARPVPAPSAEVEIPAFPAEDPLLEGDPLGGIFDDPF